MKFNDLDLKIYHRVDKCILPEVRQLERYEEEGFHDVTPEDGNVCLLLKSSGLT